MEAKLHLNKPNPTLVTSSLVKRGIKKVQVLSMRKGLRELVNGTSNSLSSLNCSGCYNLSDSFMEGAFQVKKEYKALKTLNLSLCKEVNDETLGRISQTTTNLEDLDLAGCNKITNGGLLFIGWGLKKLKRLNLRSCRQLTDHGIAHLAGIALKDTHFDQIYASDLDRAFDTASIISSNNLHTSKVDNKENHITVQSNKLINQNEHN